MRKFNLQTKLLLEKAYMDFHTSYHRERDPVSLVHRYREKRDQEIAAFFACLLAYGNVTTILSSVRHVLSKLEPSPFGSIASGRFSGQFSGFRHRFTTGEDLEVLCIWLSSVLNQFGSLETFFAKENTEQPIKILISRFVQRLVKQPVPKNRQRNLKYLLSDPMRGSACKRLNMFLRWMVRPADGIDLGLWTVMKPEKLMLPIDTHILQALRALRWTRCKQATWKVVEEATAQLRLYSPSDPIRYDFSLCHLSMDGKKITDYPMEGETVRAAME